MSTRAGGGGRKIRGVIIGVVTNIKDPDELGRVKVRFPWMDGADDPIESHWARLCGWYAGNSRGTLFVPEIGDEVLIAFEGGDPNHPYILGAVFNGEHAVPGPGNPDGKNDHKWFRSRSGHDMEFLDTDGAEKIRLVDASQNNSIVWDTAADTWTTEAKTGTINIAAPTGFIHIDCVDFTQTTSKSRTLEVGETHTVTVGQTRTLNVDDANWVQMAGTSYTVTTPQFESTTKTDLGLKAGAMVNNQGTASVSVGTWTELQQGPVVRTAGSQSLSTKAYTTVNTAGDSPAVFTLLAGSMTVSTDGALFVNGGPTTLMGGMINAKGSGAVIAKDLNGGKAALSTWLGGLLLLNPNALTFPATKLLDPIVGMDFHGPTLPAPVVPPLPPLPLVPMPFGGPILIDFKATVLINFMPACGSGATAISFHMPPLPWPWIPLSYRGMFTSAIMALAMAPFMAMLEMGKAKAASLAAASGNPTLKRGFIADFIGSSHVQPPANTQAVGDNKSVQTGDQGQFKISRLFPMFQSAQSFIGFLAGLLPLPVATGSVNMNSPTTTVCDAPLGMMIPLGANSCCDIPPIVPNAMVVGFSNVLTGMSIGDFLGQLAWSMATAKAQQKFQAGVRRGGNALARRIADSDSPRLQNVAQRVNDFVGGDNCIARGHPVDVVSGTMFTSAIDFQLFGAQTATWRRFYNAKAAEMPNDRSALGPGWRHSLDQILMADESDGVRTLALRDDENAIIGFDLPLVDGETDFHPYLRLTLTRIDGRTYSIRDASDTVRVFRFSGGKEGEKAPPTYQPPVGKIARLVQLKTPIGGEGIRPKWNRDRLMGFTDACEREVICKYTHMGLLEELRLKRSQGEDCDIFLARYRYDGDGRLIAHQDRNQNLRWYLYDKRSRMVRETDRNGYSFHFHYDELDRCTHTYGDDNAFYCAFEYVPGCTVVGDALGGVTRYRYDEMSRVTEVHDAEGGITQTSYTEEGWVESKTDANGGVIEFAYDARGALNRVVDAIGHATTFERCGDGRLIGTTDAHQNIWRIERDNIGHVRRTISPMGRTRAFSYDEHGRLKALQLGTEHSETRTWKSGQLSSVLRPNGTRLVHGYDYVGRLVRTTEFALDGSSRLIELGYDAEGRLASVDGPCGLRERYERLPEGQAITMERDGQIAHRRYEGWGRLIEHTDPGGRSTRVAYDVNHQITQITLPDLLSWRYVRDRLGRVTRMQAPDGSSTRYTYDSGGQLVEEDRPDGRVRRQYDPKGNLIKVEWPDRVTQRFEYDSLDRMVCAQAPGHRSVKRTYNPDGELVLEVQGDAFVRWRYNAQGRVIRRDTSWGTVERFGYKTDGLVGVVDPTGDEHQLLHDAWGRRALWARPNGLYHKTRFDLLDRPLEETFEGKSGAILHRRLAWGGRSAVTSIDESFNATQTRHQYRYDMSNRLIGWRRNDHDEYPYEFDLSGNLVRDRQGDRVHEGQRLQVAADGRRPRYDQRGRMVALDLPGESRRFWFDARDRLRRVHTADERVVHHVYDAVGRLAETLAEEQDGGVRRTVFYWSGNTLLRRTRFDHSNDRCVSDEHYTFDPQRSFVPLFRAIRSEGKWTQRQDYVVDQRGAPIGLLDASGTVLWSATIDPYGGYHEQATDVEQPIRLLGQVFDSATGLGHHRFRVYDSTLARFITTDPIGVAGGLHTYAYPADPIGWADPLGLWEYLFRGTTDGYNGNLGVQMVRRTPTSTNPAIATIFATQSEVHGRGVIHVASQSDLTGIRTGEGNVLAHIEQEIGVHALPRRVRNRSNVTISAENARAILNDMGISTPRRIRDYNHLSQAVADAPRMSRNQIRKFVRRAQEFNENPRCRR